MFPSPIFSFITTMLIVQDCHQEQKLKNEIGCFFQNGGINSVQEMNIRRNEVYFSHKNKKNKWTQV